MFVVVVMFMRISMMVMIVIACVTVSVIVCADANRAVVIDQVEYAENQHPDSGNQSVNAKGRIKVFVDSSGREEVEESRAPDQQCCDGQNGKKLFHLR
jgi:hypothetical protein